MIATTRHPILFPLAGIRAHAAQPLGVGPFFGGTLPLPAMRFLLTGVSLDSTGAALAGCTCTLFRVSTDLNGLPCYTQMDQVVSDGGGNYSFSVGLGANYRVTWDLAGAPARAGISLNTLVGV